MSGKVLPHQFLPKSMATSSLVSYTVTKKYDHHIPLYRQSYIWNGLGVDLPRNTLCDWILKAADSIEPLYTLLRSMILASPYCQADETPVQVLQEIDRNNQQKSYMWVYRGGTSDQPVILFEYQPTRSGQSAKDFLSGFKGYLQTDGYKGYDWVQQDANIIHLGCMAHARRPFAELVKLTKKPGKAHQALVYIQRLYRIEKELREKQASPDEIYAIRQKKSLPILKELYKWLQNSHTQVPLKGKLGKGITYMLDRKKELINYCLDGRLHIDNNLIENTIRPFVIGKKNWLFAGSPRGAKAGAILYSLIATAKANHKNVFHYLKHVFDHIHQSQNNLEKLLPWNFNPDTS